ncbi:FAD dependent oxidoreductase [Aspergillus ellipticus CBS 707.79]|uniref:FAD dependent oxidoreductase n=1 Tax=Aspergillus ellipticus CBS 707.79 TaxID=1448320 RepID=A0A319D9H0_9EURO|nr:FAD dependent oxidoreductase [Aspergillus ellipticus CBS 707.79]
MATTTNPAANNPTEVDVCILGGGAAGTYAAIRLHQEHKSIALIERQPHLGGQTTTYTCPNNTHPPIDYGVTYFQDLLIVRAMFSYFNIPLSSTRFKYKIDMFDFRTGGVIPPLPHTDSESEAAMQRYLAQLARYPFLKTGFELPDPVPEDLLLPFGEFWVKHGLQPARDDLGTTVVPIGDWPALPSVYVMKYVNAEVLEGDRETGFVRPVGRNNAVLYERAQQVLGEGGQRLLFGSRVVEVERDGDGDWVRVRVRGEDGEEKLVRAKRIIVAVPPTMENLEAFGLGATERRLFGQFNYFYFYTGLVRIDGLPADVCYMNRAEDDPFMRPRFPGMIILKAAEVPELRGVQYGSLTPMSEGELRQGILEDLDSIRRRTGVDFPDPEFLALGDHSPYEMSVSAEAIRNGFYRELNALQGERRTYYTGATFESHNTPQIWEFTEQLLQKHILKSLE